MAVPLPPLNLNNQQSAASGAGGGSAGGGASDWVVNYGGEISQSTGKAVPEWVWLAGAVLALVWIKRKG